MQRCSVPPLFPFLSISICRNQAKCCWVKQRPTAIRVSIEVMAWRRCKHVPRQQLTKCTSHWNASQKAWKKWNVILVSFHCVADGTLLPLLTQRTCLVETISEDDNVFKQTFHMRSNVNIWDGQTKDTTTDNLNTLTHTLWSVGNRFQLHEQLPMLGCRRYPKTQWLWFVGGSGKNKNICPFGGLHWFRNLYTF